MEDAGVLHELPCGGLVSSTSRDICGAATEVASWLGFSWKSYMHCWTVSFNAGVIVARQELTISSIIDV